MNLGNSGSGSLLLERCLNLTVVDLLDWWDDWDLRVGGRRNPDRGWGRSNGDLDLTIVNLGNSWDDLLRVGGNVWNRGDGWSRSVWASSGWGLNLTVIDLGDGLSLSHTGGGTLSGLDGDTESGWVVGSTAWVSTWWGQSRPWLRWNVSREGSGGQSSGS